MNREDYKNFDNFIKKYIQNCVNIPGIPGIAVVIFNSDKILHKYIYGYSDLKTKRELKITDKFCIASCVKSILCSTIASLIDKKIIPNLWEMTLKESWSSNIHPKFKQVKVKQLASHCSGITGYDSIDGSIYCDEISTFQDTESNNNIFDKLKNIKGLKSRKMLADTILQRKPSYRPGSKFEYSNLGYGILGAILEKWTRKSFIQNIKNEIIKPLNIDMVSKFHYNEESVNGHYVGKKWSKNERNKLYPIKKGEYFSLPFEAPAGNEFFISVIDSAKYCQSYLRSFNNNGLLDLSTVKYLTTPIIENYGYGWQKTEDYIRHAGIEFFTETEYIIYPQKNIGIVVSTNMHNPEVIGPCRTIRREFIRMMKK